MATATVLASLQSASPEEARLQFSLEFRHLPLQPSHHPGGLRRILLYQPVLFAAGRERILVTQLAGRPLCRASSERLYHREHGSGITHSVF